MKLRMIRWEHEKLFCSPDDGGFGPLFLRNNRDDRGRGCGDEDRIVAGGGIRG